MTTPEPMSKFEKWGYFTLFMILLYVAIKTYIDLSTGYTPTL
jgi:hypothetical protein